MNIITTEQILILHGLCIEVYGGDKTYRENTKQNIENIIDQLYPKFGYDKYPCIYSKSAKLWYSLCKNHCFTDGNKRIATITMITMLNINNIELKIDEETLTNKTIEIATSKLNQNEIDNYIKELSDFLRGCKK